MHTGFRLASDCSAVASALQSASQRVLRSEVEVDESKLIDLIGRSEKRAKSSLSEPLVASSRVLIFWKGASSKERGGGLYLEKLDYLQGEALAEILTFWTSVAREARAVLEDRWDEAHDFVATGDDGLKHSLA